MAIVGETSGIFPKLRECVASGMPVGGGQWEGPITDGSCPSTESLYLYRGSLIWLEDPNNGDSSPRLGLCQWRHTVLPDRMPTMRLGHVRCGAPVRA
jgi:hypothetical protein